MKKNAINLEVLKKIVARFIKAAPETPAPTEAPNPIARIVQAFLEFDCDKIRSEAAEKRLLSSVVDYNELRVTPAIELAATIGTRYPYAEYRCTALHYTLHALYDTENAMTLARLHEMKKPEIRPFLRSLAGMTAYIEAAVAMDCFDVPAVPIDTKLLLYLQAKGAITDDAPVDQVQTALEKLAKGENAAKFFAGSRVELDTWQPKTWPASPKVGSAILPSNMDQAREGVVVELAKTGSMAQNVKAEVDKARAAKASKTAKVAKETKVEVPAEKPAKAVKSGKEVKVEKAPVKTTAKPVAKTAGKSEAKSEAKTSAKPAKVVPAPKSAKPAKGKGK